MRELAREGASMFLLCVERGSLVLWLVTCLLGTAVCEVDGAAIKA